MSIRSFGVNELPNFGIHLCKHNRKCNPLIDNGYNQDVPILVSPNFQLVPIHCQAVKLVYAAIKLRQFVLSGECPAYIPTSSAVFFAMTN